jgi:hypothetical protein
MKPTAEASGMPPHARKKTHRGDSGARGQQPVPAASSTIAKEVKLEERIGMPGVWVI